VAIVKCIAPYGTHVIGDLVEIPDGSEASPMFFAPVAVDDSDRSANQDEGAV
jgi:hypothetical protein